jgi:two-component system response regulator YesN
VIEENYSDENLSLQEVAKHVHISSSYLSTMFKKEKNENFIDYLTKVRMQKAQELLRNTTMKAYEVARVVGYGNPQYFSLCFKKYTGYSPLQFKNV